MSKPVRLSLGSLALLAASALASDARAEEAPPELKAKPDKPSVRAKELSRPFVEATKKVRPAVVRIRSLAQRDRRGRALSSGSGVIISKKGHLLTNRHVIAGAAGLEIQLMDGRKFRKVKVLGADPRSDVAILRIEGAKDLPVAKLGDSDALEVGEWVIAIGAPFDLASSVSTGVVSAKGRTEVVAGVETLQSFIQTDAALNPGNSGGPLINLDGHVVGINTAIRNPYQRTNTGIGFSVPINLARSVAISLLERGVATKGWLGISIRQVLGPAEMKRRGIDAPTGFVLATVQKGSPAAKAGLRPGDVVVAFDGVPLRNEGILRARLAQYRPGSEVVIRLHRGTPARAVDAKVRLGEEPVDTFGLEVRTLDDNAARRIGLRGGERGALITKVSKTSPFAADRDGLLPGDVIVTLQIDRGRPSRVRNREDFHYEMLRLQQRMRGGVKPRVVVFGILTESGLTEIALRLGRTD